MTNPALSCLSVALPAPPVGWFDYDYALLSDGSLALVRTDIDMFAEHAAWQDAASKGRRAPPPDPHRARLSRFDGSNETTAIEVPLEGDARVDRLADGRWIVAGTTTAEGERNGRIYDSDGSPSGALMLGDGIQHLRCAPDGTIWVGYFDEGIFSGPNRDGSWPVSTGGIARFSASGDLLWSFNHSSGSELLIDDCYAMTLAGDVMWSTFYSTFPVVMIDEGKVITWSNSLAGANALAVEDDHLLLAGGYGEDVDRLALLRLEDGRTTCLSQLRFPAMAASGPRLVQGLAGTLHVVGAGRWLELDVGGARRALQDRKRAAGDRA